MKKIHYKFIGPLAFFTNYIWAGSGLLPDVAVSDINNHVVINIPNVKLYVYKDGAYDSSYPIAVGKNLNKTPMGDYQIGTRAHNPTWYIPASIQKERKKKGLPDVKSIAPGPNNPLGPLFIRFGENKKGLGIHGTNVPSSVPGIRSHGCVRMKNEDITKLDKKVYQGDLVSVTYQMYALNVDEANQLWFQKYPNPYKFKDQYLDELKISVALWQEQNNQKIDEQKFNQLLKKSQSKPSCLTCSKKNAKIQGKLRSIAWTEGRADIRTPQHSEPIDKSVMDELFYQPNIRSPQPTWTPEMPLETPEESPSSNTNNLF